MKHTFLHFSLFRSYSFQSFFSCVLLSLSSTFYLSPLSFFAYPLLSLSVFLVCLLLSCSAFYLSPLALTFFVYHLIFLSASISFFVFYFPSWLSSTFILCLSSIIFPLLFSLSFCTFVCVLFYYYYHFYSPCSSFPYFLPFNFLSAFSAYFSTFSFSFIFFTLHFFPLSLIVLC